jgi:hypothetical protein
VAACALSRSYTCVGYRRPKAPCIPRSRSALDEAVECAPPTPEEIERMMALFRDGGRMDAADANMRAALAEDRQALGLAPMRPRR